MVGPGRALAVALAAAAAIAFPDAEERGARAGNLWAQRHELPWMRAVCVPAGTTIDGWEQSACLLTDGRRAIWLVCTAFDCDEP